MRNNSCAAVDESTALRSEKHHSPFKRKRENSPVSNWPRSFERRTAPAGPRRIWIHNMKTNAGQTVAKIQGSAAQVWNTLSIDKKLHPLARHYSIAFFFFVERHFVVKTRTAALCNLHTQTFVGIFCLSFKQTPKLTNSVVGDVNHDRVKPTIQPHQVNQCERCNVCCPQSQGIYTCA